MCCHPIQELFPQDNYKMSLVSDLLVERRVVSLIVAYLHQPKEKVRGCSVYLVMNGSFGSCIFDVQVLNFRYVVKRGREEKRKQTYHSLIKLH